MAARVKHTENQGQTSFVDALFYEPARCEQPVRESALPAFRIELVRDNQSDDRSRDTIRSPEDAARIFERYLKGADREQFVIMFLDTKNRVIGLNTVSIGTLDSALVHPREVFMPAILANASSIIVCHNHPSGDPQPSHEDRQVTIRLAEAAKILGIELHDHIIVGCNGTHSSLKLLGLF